MRKQLKTYAIAGMALFLVAGIAVLPSYAQQARKRQMMAWIAQTLDLTAQREIFDRRVEEWRNPLRKSQLLAR